MKKQAHLLFDTFILGIMGALGAELFRLLLQFFHKIFFDYIAEYSPPVLQSEGGNLVETIGSHGLWLIPLVLVIGGLISGFIVYKFAPEAEGHGTDTAVKAFHMQAGAIRKRVTPIKIVASAITIGSGGSAGREGPTALFSAGFGSIYAGILNRTEKERRLLVLIGMAAGLSAIFRSPIGTAIFAIEVLYSDMEFETEALIYTMLGSIIAYALNSVIVGWEPLFRVPGNLIIEHFSDYAWYVLLGIASGIIGTILPNVFYYTRDLFKKIPIKNHFKPAIGGLGVGLIALAFPQVLGGGYGWIQKTINGELVISLLLILVFGKMISFALTVSSGGSGGVFAPTLFVGAMLGGLFAKIFNLPPAAFTVVGMAAVFGSSARVPIATLLMVTEMTGGYNLLVPAALAVILGFYIQDFLCNQLNVKYISLYEAQVERQSDSQAHRMEHLKRALSMLKDQKKIDPGAFGKIDLVSLLESSIPVNITENERLLLGKLSSQSKCINSLISSRCLNDKNEDWKIMAIIRNNELLFPEPDLKLNKGDEILVLCSSNSIDDIRSNFEN
ncbi:MAG TPA: chloride channel protein [Ignavibacteriaceae bacterium]|nr:chloride channel protein [Ignavibacteriaceae bacterium]